ncbi:Holo-ACP synthase [Candidatus Bealeia paramacronuclearis]|uniref:Holo-[acyl-carrier-protein] synthase n=1 Tax=Candidatus Bealeia paramacronuclearis TaxID=1921001 RepID=A0ABZ2C9C0_9PROT|nr:Holo-ACP synthase [Candidatus Bealeia paramacronuclearis]
MILGIGSDLVDVNRIKTAYERFGERFLDKIFTPREREYAFNQPRPERAFAKRFAAKEALVKALGSGFRGGLSWQEMEVVNDVLGKPSFALSGRTLQALQEKTPYGHQSQIDLSLSDDYPYALAFIVISANPTGEG